MLRSHTFMVNAGRWVLVAGLSAASMASAAEWKHRLGAITQWGAFSRGPITYSCTAVEGPLGAMENVELQRIKVGSETIAPKSARIFAGRTLTLRHGSVLGDAVAGENAWLRNFDSGRVFAGRIADCLEGTYAACQSNSSVGIHLEHMRAVERDILSVSRELSTFASEKIVAGTDGQLRLVATARTSVFSVSADELSRATGVIIEGTSDSLVVVNVTGTSANLSQHGDRIRLYGVDADRVVFNFYEATGLVIHATNLQGTVLAPFAETRFTEGQLRGSLLVGGLVGAPRSPLSLLSFEPCNGSSGALRHVPFRP